jgi:hypothetical protein
MLRLISLVVIFVGICVCHSDVSVEVVIVPRAQVDEWLSVHRHQVLEVVAAESSDNEVTFVIRIDHHVSNDARSTTVSSAFGVRHKTFSLIDDNGSRATSTTTTTTYKVILWEPIDDQRWNGMEILINTPSEPSVVVSVDSASAKTAIKFLMNQPQVRWIEPWQPVRVHDAYGNWRVQSDRKTVCNQTSPFFGCTPMWDSGLLGQQQVLGIGDSGLYLRHCFFNDVSCGPSIVASPQPACGGSSYLNPVCPACVPYCLSSDGVACHPLNSNHRSANAYRATEGDFDDRQVMHGTAVASVAAGSVVDSPLAQFLMNQGVVPAARLLMHDMSVDNGQATVDVPSPIDTAYLAWFQTNGARVSSHSWGTPPISGYNSDSQAIDRWMWQNPDHLVVFSAGNEGDPTTAGQYLQIGPHAASKNALVVGATMGELELLLMFGAFASQENLNAQSNATRWSSNFLASFSSVGPTLDRRIKPDIVMPGQMVMAARANAARQNDADGSCVWPDAVAGWSGTSFSAPLAAGYAVMLRQWAIERKGIQTPRSSLIKALFAAASRPLLGINYYDAPGNPMVEANQLSRPEWSWGHGRPVLEQLLEPSRTFIENEAQWNLAGGFVAYCVRTSLFASSENVIDSALAWTDPPGSVSGSQYASRLVNDIDLSAVDSACDVFYGNYQNSPDRDNNLERVSLPVGNALGINSAVHHVFIVRAEKIQVPAQPWSFVINQRNSAPQPLSAEEMIVDLKRNQTNYPSYHPCSMIVTICRQEIGRLLGEGSPSSSSSVTPSPSSSPSSSSSSASFFSMPLPYFSVVFASLLLWC